MLTIVCPVYNEKENITNLLEEINYKIKTEKELLIIYDTDNDTTLEILPSLIPLYNFKIIPIKNIYGKGVLNAIKTGFKKANYDIILVIMADLSDDLTKVDEMYKLIKNGYDIVCGSRYMKGGKQIGGPWFKKLLSKMAGLSFHILTKIPTHDITNSFKMYSKKVIDEIKIESVGGFEIGMEITIKAYLNGRKITEIPTIWKDRKFGKSNFKLLKWLPYYLKWYFYPLIKLK
ncbi:MAG: glycosyltransferase [Elusimicrobiales bacterium]|nr:glycosyltransferase [Elusimicrobiales bacterium]